MTRDVLEVAFLTQLGHALSAAGDPVSSTERTLKRVAQAYGRSDVEIAVLPTLVPLAVPSAPGRAVAATTDPCGPSGNAITCENSKPGSPPSVWDVDQGAGDDDIQADGNVSEKPQMIRIEPL